jgi:hypothetical protein
LFVFALGLTASAVACGGDDDDDGTGLGAAGSTSGTSHDSGAPMRSGACELGCEQTIIARCAMGPDTQLQCETDCERLRTGACGSEYRAYMACGDGKRVTCDDMGLPIVAACEDERSAFLACLQ